MRFERYLAIDWSGAGTDDSAVDVAAAEWQQPQAHPTSVPPSGDGFSRRWTRARLFRWMRETVLASMKRATSRADRIGRAVAHFSFSNSICSSRMPCARRSTALMVVFTDSTTPKRTE